MNERQADVLIVGAGVVGLSVAYYAASAGAKVVVLEKGEIGAGSSSGNAGLIVLSFFRTPSRSRGDRRGLKASL